MVCVLFDTNVYDLLANDLPTCQNIAALHARGFLTVIVNRTVAEELHKSPFRGVPNLFPIERVGNTVGRVGILRAGDSLGAGNVYYEHLGQSTKVNDALIADAASWHADWLVSEDERLRKRIGSIEAHVRTLSYAEFLERFESVRDNLQASS